MINSIICFILGHLDGDLWVFTEIKVDYGYVRERIKTPGCLRCHKPKLVATKGIM